MFQLLPTDILVEGILSRLPVKSLLRLRCVCKECCRLINTPYFINTHLDRSMRNNNNYSTLIQYSSDMYTLDYDASNPVVKVDCPSTILTSCRHVVKIWGSCNGLVLLGDELGWLIWLWNPSCRRHKQVPTPPIPTRNIIDNYTTCIKLGFCYNEISNDYEIVRITRCGTHNSARSEVEIYSLNNNSWTWIETIPYLFIYNRLKGEFCNGCLYWIGNPNRPPENDFLLAFDIGSRKFREVLQIPPHKEKGLDFCHVSALDGCLYFFPDYDDARVVLRIQIPHHSPNVMNVSWIELSMEDEDNYSTGLGVTKRGDIIVETDDVGLYYYDTKAKSLRLLLSTIKPQFFHQAVTFVESLVSP